MSACWTVKGCGNDPCTCYQQPVESAQQNEPNDELREAVAEYIGRVKSDSWHDWKGKLGWRYGFGYDAIKVCRRCGHSDVFAHAQRRGRDNRNEATFDYEDADNIMAIVSRLSGGQLSVTLARPLEEWHEDMGPMLWWRFPIVEEPYVGQPLDDNFPKDVTHFTAFAVPDGGCLSGHHQLNEG